MTTRKHTSSPASAAGTPPSGSPVGQQADLFGLPPSPASPSPTPAKAKGSRMKEDSFGSLSSGSPQSAALSQSLANRLRQRLERVGSIEYSQTWKQLVTPAGRSYWAHTASPRRTEDSASTGWPTPKTLTGGPNSKRQERGSGGADLQEVAAWATPKAEDSESSGVRHSRGVADTLTAMASWATPGSCDATRGSAETDADKRERGANPGQSLIDQASLTSWPTASSRDWKDTPGMATEGVNPDGSKRKRMDQLPRVAAWATPAASDKKFRGTPNTTEARLKSGKQISLEAQAVTSGGTTESSDSKTAVKGALNPALSRWLQGYPKAWCVAAIRAYRLMRPTRRKRGG